MLLFVINVNIIKFCVRVAIIYLLFMFLLKAKVKNSKKNAVQMQLLTGKTRFLTVKKNA